MNNTSSQKSERRILLSIDAVSYTPEVIDLAVEMAATLKLELHGLFVEDIDLLNIAGRPFSSEITLSTAEERVLNTDNLMRSFRAISEKIRERIEQAASLANIQWSFETIRGRRIETGLASYQNSEMVIISQQTRITSQTSKQYVVTRQRRCQRLLMIESDSPTLQHMMDLIQQLSNKINIDLTALTSDQLPLSMLESIKAASGIISVRNLPFNEETLSQLLQNTTSPFDYVIVPQTLSGELLQKIIGKSICPVIVVT